MSVGTKLGEQMAAQVGQRSPTGAGRGVAVLEGPREPRLRTEGAGQGESQSTGDLGRRDPAGRAAHNHGKCGAVCGRDCGYAAGRGERAHLGWDDQVGPIGAGQREQGRLIEPPREIDHDKIAAAPARVEGCGHGLGRHTVEFGSIKRQHGEAALSGQGVDEGRWVDPPSRVDKLGPPKALESLPPENKVDTAAQGVRVDQQSVEVTAAGRHGERRRQHTGTGTPTAPDHGHHETTRHTAAGLIDEAVDQPGLSRRKHGHLLGPQCGRLAPRRLVVRSTGNHDDGAPRRQPGPDAGIRGVGA